MNFNEKARLFCCWSASGQRHGVDGRPSPLFDSFEQAPSVHSRHSTLQHLEELDTENLASLPSRKKSSF